MRLAANRCVESVVGDNHAVVGIVQRGCKTAAHYVAEYVEQDDVVFLEGIEFFEQFDGFSDDVAAATSSCGWAACFYAVNAAVAFVDDIFWPNVFVVIVLFLKGVNNCGDQEAGQGKCAVVLWIATDLQNFLAALG